MKRYMIVIPTIILVIAIATLLFFVYMNPSQANISVNGDACAITDNLSSSDNAQIDAYVSNITAESGKEYIVEDFTGI